MEDLPARILSTTEAGWPHLIQEVNDVLKRCGRSIFDGQCERCFPLFEALIQSFTSSAWQQLSKKNKSLFVSLFCAGCPLDAVFAVSKCLTSEEKNVAFVVLIMPHLIKKLAQTHYFTIFEAYSVRKVRSDRLANEVCKFVASGPDIILNVRECRQMHLDVSGYFRNVSIAICRCLDRICHFLRNEKDCSLQFLGILLSKIEAVGYSDRCLGLALHFLSKKCASGDWICIRVTRKLFKNVIGAALEGVIIHAVKAVKSGETLRLFLDDLILKNVHAKYALTSRLIFQRNLPDVNLVALMSYLCSFLKVRESLLSIVSEVWSSETAICTNSLSQQVYLSKVLILLAHGDGKPNNVACNEFLITGVSAHLGSPNPQVRQLGMVVGEILSSEIFGPKTDEKLSGLNFGEGTQGELCDEIRSILSHRHGEQTVQSGSVDDAMEDQQFADAIASLELSGNSNHNGKESSAPDNSEFDDDDDDDLVPINSDSSVAHAVSLAPKYIRDAIEGLLEAKNGSDFIASFQVLPELIRRRVPGFREVAAELVRLLLSLENRFGAPDFDAQCTRCAIAACVQAPDLVAPFLTGQFFAPNYNLRQRFDMLRILEQSARELAGLCEDEKEASDQEPFKIRIRLSDLDSDLDTQPVPEGGQNAFSDVAGIFFFPLINGIDGKRDHLDLFGRDFQLLGALIKAMASMIFCAQNCPLILPNMLRSMFDLTKLLRFHSVAFIRQSMLFALLICFMVIPSQMMFQEFGHLISDFHDWLSQTATNDDSTECQAFARQCLGMLAEKVTSAEKNDAFDAVGAGRKKLLVEVL